MAVNSWSTSGSYREFTRTGTSASGVADSGNVITAASGTTIVLIEHTANGISGNTTGLRSGTGTITPVSDLTPYVYTSTSNNALALMRIGTNNNDRAGLNPTYGDIEAFSIHNISSTTNNYYMSVIGTGSNTTSLFFKSRYLKASGATDTWIATTSNVVNGHVFYGITSSTTSSTTKWIGFSFLFEANCTYDVFLQPRCTNNYEGIAVYTTAKSTDPGTSRLITNIGAAYTAPGNIPQTFTVTPTSNTTYRFYFRQNVNGTSGQFRYAAVRIIRKTNVTFSGNDTNVSTGFASIIPYAGNNAVITSPVTRYGTNGVNYTFKGYFTAQSGGTQILDTNGYYVNTDKKLETNDTSVTLYAHWGNTIYYSRISTSLYAWCTNSAQSASSTTGNVSVKMAYTGVKCASGETVSITYNPTTVASGFSPNSNAEYLNISNGKSAGSYTQNRISFVSPSGGNYESASVSYIVPKVWISAVTAATYGTPTQPTITQKTNIPASGITLNSTELGTYFSHTNAIQTITYTNSKTRNGTITYTWGGSATIANRGDVYGDTVKTVALGNNVYLRSTGENNVSSTKYITSASQAQNLITDIYVNISPEQCYYDLYQTIVVEIIARYTSGATRVICPSACGGLEDGVHSNFIIPSFLALYSIYE